MKKADRIALLTTLEEYKPSGILVTMMAMVIAVIALAMYLATDEPPKMEEFIGTVERLEVDQRDGVDHRFLVVRVATGESVTLPIADDVAVYQGAEVRLARGMAGGGRMVYEFVRYLNEPPPK